MRTLFLLAFLLGALAMSDTATGDDKKANPQDKESYTEKATVKQWVAGEKKFGPPVKDVPAFVGEIKGQMVIYTRPKAESAYSPKGSEIAIGETVYVVDRVSKASSYHINYVTKKEPEKKP